MLLLLLGHSERWPGVLRQEGGPSPAVSRSERNPFGGRVNRLSVGVSNLGGMCLGRREQMDVDGQRGRL